MSSNAPKAMAGWYPHPEMAGTVRYWDGDDWTDQVAPAGASSVPQSDQSAPQSDQIALIATGWILLFVLPIGGVIVGLALANRRPALGLTMAGLSAIAMIVWLVALTS